MIDLSQKLSPNFTLGELVCSEVGSRQHLDNTPTPDIVEALRALCSSVLQPIRDRWGVVFINSGYRGPAVNRAVGGVATSQHLFGEAADITVPALSKPDLVKWIAATLDYDQVIQEHCSPQNPAAGWVHVSFTTKHANRRMALVIDADGKTSTLV